MQMSCVSVRVHISSCEVLHVILLKRYYVSPIKFLGDFYFCIYYFSPPPAYVKLDQITKISQISKNVLGLKTNYICYDNTYF
jgi:hypothetical protein